MNSFTMAAQSCDTLTDNGAITHSTSGSACVDLFGNIGSMRNRSEGEIISMFSKALGENPLDALKILFWSRDIRGGAGERKTPQILLKWLAESYPTFVVKNINLIPYYGRWDDLFCLFGTECQDSALVLIEKALEAGDALCAKWMPRVGSSKAPIAYIIRQYLGLSQKQYRQLLVSLSKTVEQQMCKRDWSTIQYAQVPSLAMTRYRKAFGRQDGPRFAQYLEDCKSKKTAIHAGTLLPHNIVKHYLFSADRQVDDTLEEQWKALPNYMSETTERIMPLLDVSGSMTCGSPRAIDICISLGTYIAERNVGPFKDHYIEFSAKATMHQLQGYSLRDRINNVSQVNWGCNTDIQGAFNLILGVGIRNNILESDMPTILLCFSD